MKDKRQRLALTWPFGAVDPSIYSYLLTTAANLSAQGFPQTRTPWHYLHPALQPPPVVAPGLQHGALPAPGLHAVRTLTPHPHSLGAALHNMETGMALSHNIKSHMTHMDKNSGFHPYRKPLQPERSTERREEQSGSTSDRLSSVDTTAGDANSASTRGTHNKLFFRPFEPSLKN